MAISSTWHLDSACMGRNQIWQTAAHLDQVGRQAFAAVGVKVGEGGSHARDGNTVSHGQADDLAPGLLALDQLGREEGVHQQVLQVAVALVGGFDVVQEPGADDAAALNAHQHY